MKRKGKDEIPDADLEQWPRSRYEVKGDYIGLIEPYGNTWKPIPPEGSAHRTYEIYKVARECLLKNLSARLVTPPEYKKLFAMLNLHNLHLKIRTIHGRTWGICIVCHKELSGDQIFYCSDQCRNTEKQRRGRDKHPERKLKR